MLSDLLVNATGAVALCLNVSAVLFPNDHALMRRSGWASAVWTANNLLLGAQAAAALSALSVARQAGVAALHGRSAQLRRAGLAAFVAATLAIAWLGWSGWTTLFPVAGSLVGTVAMFQLGGVRLRLALVGINALWMVGAVAHDAWWQVAANVIAGAAAAAGAWRAGRPAGPHASGLPTGLGRRARTLARALARIATALPRLLSRLPSRRWRDRIGAEAARRWNACAAPCASACASPRCRAPSCAW